MPDVSITKGITLDLLETPGTPALSSTSDLPVVETKPDAQNEGAPPELPAAGEEAKPAETPEQPGESATPATEEHPGEPAKKESRGVQKALDRLTAEREEQRRRAEAAEQRLDRALTALERSTGEPAEAGRRAVVDENPEPVKPNKQDFPEVSDWERALIDYSDKRAEWVAKKEVQAARVEEQNRNQEAAIRTQHTALQEAHLGRMEKARAKYEDFHEVAESPDQQVSIPIVAAILHSDNGAELQYYLGKNPQELQRLNALPPPLQILELGKIEERLTSPQVKPNVSAAPKPITPSKPGASSAEKNPEEMSMEEYASWRHQQERDQSARRH